MTAAVMLTSSGMFREVFTAGVLRAATADPMPHVPRLIAVAASMRFSAASQQSAATNGLVPRPPIRMSVLAS